MIFFTAAALADLERQLVYWRSIEPRLAMRFAAAAREATERANDAPRRFPTRGVAGARRCPFKLGRQTFYLDFREEDGDIVVLRVWHARQHRPV